MAVYHYDYYYYLSINHKNKNSNYHEIDKYSTIPTYRNR